MYKKILVAVDGSAPSMQAIRASVDFASSLKAKLVLLHVVDITAALVPELGIIDQKMLDKLQVKGKAILQDAFLSVTDTSDVEQMLIEGDPADTILETALHWKADMIVLGSDSRGRLAHFLLGSTADAVIRRAPCPVLSVREKADSRISAQASVLTTA